MWSYDPSQTSQGFLLGGGTCVGMWAYDPSQTSQGFLLGGDLCR